MRADKTCSTRDNDSFIHGIDDYKRSELFLYHAKVVLRPSLTDTDGS